MPTYRDAGVDLDAAAALVARIKPLVTSTWHPGVVGGFGGFAGGIAVPSGYRHPILMLSTDGVGTKAELARVTGRLDGLGRDLVAMCIDDLVAVGARPIALTDYVAVGRLDLDSVERIVGGVAAACSEAEVALLGGETAEHPGVMGADELDLAGTALGVVEAGAEIDGSAIRPGDVLIGIDSPNVRCNGFSLVRQIVRHGLSLEEPLPSFDEPAAAVLLEPSVLYAPTVLAVLESVEVHGSAHITGGGLGGNVSRILPHDCDAIIDSATWRVPAVFSALEELGQVPGEDMWRTFNMGVGFVLALDPDDVATTLRVVNAGVRDAAVIGEVFPGSGRALVH